MRVEYGLVRGIEMNKSDPFKEAMSEYKQTNTPSDMNESASRLINELQEMRREKEKTDTARTRLSVSSMFQPKILDEGKGVDTQHFDYATKSKSSNVEIGHDEEEFGETLSAFADSAKMSFYSSSSSSKPPSSANGSEAHGVMHLFAENGSSAYATSSATGTTNAHTLSGSDTFCT